jgi:hypothetical protein
VVLLFNKNISYSEKDYDIDVLPVPEPQPVEEVIKAEVKHAHFFIL